MINIHCHVCGGFVSDPTRVTYELPSDVAVMAVPQSGICNCTTSIIFGPPAGHASSPGMKGVVRST